MFLVLVGIYAAAFSDLTDATNHTSQNKTVKLINNIRRQLIEDNYDYLPTEEELITPTHDIYDLKPTDDPHGHSKDGQNDKMSRGTREDYRFYDEGVGNHKDTRDDITNHRDEYDRYNNSSAYDDENNENVDENYSSGNKDRINDRDNKKYDYSRSKLFSQEEAGNFIPRTNSHIDEDEPRTKGHEVSKKDLLYYMDDDLLKNRKAMDDKSSLDDVNNGAVTTSSSPKVKYKVLKVKSLHPNRRSMTYRRFIQEEKPEGVAIISLDEQPFPEFHLPHSRRQYMLDRDSAELSDAMPFAQDSNDTIKNFTLS